MAKRVQIKSKVVKATLANKDVLDMFHGVLGTSEGAAQLPVTYPKYLRIAHHTDRFLKLLEMVRDSALFGRFPDFHGHLTHYAATLRAQFARDFCAPNFEDHLGVPALHLVGGLPPPDGAAAYAKIPAEEIAKFNEVFAAVKRCSLVNVVVLTCSNLVKHKKALQDAKALNPKFLTKDAGLSFCPLPDLPVNFRKLYIDGSLTVDDRQYLMVVLHKLYAIGHDVYEAVSAPDVNVNDFVEVIMGSIGDVQKHIPRCEAAFKKIIESVDLLKGNFGDYYKDFTASGNPTIIMENFVVDVSKNTKSSPAVTAQFRRIIAHYRKLAAQQATNPKLKSLFAQVDANFKELEKKSKEADDEGGEDSSEGSEDSSEEAPALVGGAEGLAAAGAESPDSPDTPDAKSPVTATDGAIGPANEVDACPEQTLDTRPMSKSARKRANQRAREARAGKRAGPAHLPESEEPSLADEFDAAPGAAN